MRILRVQIFVRRSISIFNPNMENNPQVYKSALHYFVVTLRLYDSNTRLNNTSSYLFTIISQDGLILLERRSIRARIKCHLRAISRD